MQYQNYSDDQGIQKPATVLIVDDQPENLELLVQMLKNAGYDTRPALNGHVALGAVAHIRPELILMDIRMPGMDGFEVCKRLKADPQSHNIPVIFISALDDIDEKLKAFQAGGVDYISRPFQIPEVLARVATHLELVRMRGQMETRIYNHTTALETKTQKLAQETLTHRATARQLRQSEENFRQLADNINEVFWIYSANWQELHYISPAYERIWGRSCQSLYQKPESWKDSIIPQDRQKVYNALPERIDRNSKTIAIPEYRIKRPNGDLRWIRDRAFAVTDSKGDIYRVAGIAEDITDQIEMENQLRQTQKMEAIGTLAGGIAHEFNNVLGIIMGNTELVLTNTAKNSSKQHFLQDILQATVRGKEVVKQLLSFSRKSVIDRIPINPGLNVKQARQLIKVSLPGTIELNTQIGPQIHTVVADTAQITQLIINLCNNALHAMAKDGGTLKVTLVNTVMEMAKAKRLGTRSGDHVKLSVSDTGHGIMPEILDKIFDPYFTTRKFGEGTGMGLAIVHSIVLAHQGAIEVQSTVGRGTCIDVYLPARHQKEKQTIRPHQAAPTGNETILFIDDESSITRIADTMLSRLGYTVHIQNDPDKAIECFQAKPHEFDLVVTDMTMPHMTGTQLAVKILKIRKDTPIILCTGHSGQTDKGKLREIGIHQHLEKPFNQSKLAIAIRQVLDRVDVTQADNVSSPNTYPQLSRITQKA